MTFLITLEPFKVRTNDTVSLSVKNLLGYSSIDKHLFKSLSTCRFSTSYAKQKVSM